jgi:hypothetical protein
LFFAFAASIHGENSIRQASEKPTYSILSFANGGFFFRVVITGAGLGLGYDALIDHWHACRRPCAGVLPGRAGSRKR